MRRMTSLLKPGRRAATSDLRPMTILVSGGDAGAWAH